MFSKGDILLPSNRVAKRDWLNGLYHPAVIWDDCFDGNSDFNGVMLTHTGPNRQFDNILMDATHFEEGHIVGYSYTHFVNQVFVKFYRWGPFELVGRLTADGIEYIDDHLNRNSGQMEFAHYRQLVIR